eukprot:TRINITY_DN762_c0_g1_i1.p1 TRINITY_DN762_c0_g1~~TRINITY_DN762_c0_g1_i1.p1  ORF type:complete len:199 (+),score=41.37 TRINITY_DN762_c0_g1_i1:50-646(+)
MKLFLTLLIFAFFVPELIYCDDYTFEYCYGDNSTCVNGFCDTSLILEGICVCDEHFFGSYCDKFCSEGNTCKGNGVCHERDGVCNCFDCYEGDDCSKFIPEPFCYAEYTITKIVNYIPLSSNTTNEDPGSQNVVIYSLSIVLGVALGIIIGATLILLLVGVVLIKIGKLPAPFYLFTKKKDKIEEEFMFDDEYDMDEL